MTTLWDRADWRDHHPALSLEDGIRLDAIWRREDAMYAIIDTGPVSLRADAFAELDKAHADGDAWDRDIDLKLAAWCSWP